MTAGFEVFLFEFQPRLTRLFSREIVFISLRHIFLSSFRLCEEEAAREASAVLSSRPIFLFGLFGGRRR